MHIIFLEQFSGLHLFLTTELIGEYTILRKAHKNTNETYVTRLDVFRISSKTLFKLKKNKNLKVF